MKTTNFLKGRRGTQITKEEREALEGVLSKPTKLPARRLVVRAGEEVTQSILLLEGFMCRYMDDRKGNRQLVAVHLPGDFVDLHGYPLQHLDHDVATITEATVAYAPHSRLTEITQRMPHLSRMLWFSTLLDAAMHREWIFRLGRLNAAGRVAHFLAETNVRLMMIGRSDGHRYDLPMTQTDLGEACGLTQVHTSRTLSALRRGGIADVQCGVVHIKDRRELQRLAEFDAAYLYPDDQQRVP